MIEIIQHIFDYNVLKFHMITEENLVSSQVHEN